MKLFRNALVALVAALAMTAGASTAHAQAADPEKTGDLYGVRSLTLAEVKARGLDKGIDVSKLTTIKPRIVIGKSGLAAEQGGDQTAAVAPATACWTGWFRSGTNYLYGRTDVSWCGDGTWVRYAVSGCWGYASSWPGYKYLSCDNRPAYGAGWNVYEVWSQWHLCPGWNAATGQCWVKDSPFQKWQFQGNGAMVRIG